MTAKKVSGRLLAKALIVLIIITVTATSAYMLVNTQRSSQLNTLMATYLLYAGSPGGLRIVSQAPSITEIIFGLGLEEYLVGCTTYCDYPPKLQSMIASGKVYNNLSWWNPSLEPIVDLKPSIVLLDAGVSSHLKLAEKLAEQGIPFLILSRGGSIAEIESTIFQLGSFFSSATNSRSVEAAQKLVNAMREKMSAVNGTISGQAKVKVLFCVWINIGGNTIYTVGRPTFLNEIIERAGGINIYGNLEEAWPRDALTLEKAAYNDPDVIVIMDHHASLNPSQVLSDMANTPLANTPAYQNGRVFFLQGQADSLFARSGPRVAEGVELLAHILFPGVFNASFPDPHVINDSNYKNYLSSLILESTSTHTSLGQCGLQYSSFLNFVPVLPLARHPLFSFFWRVCS
ncbi:MAG: helical backbone metal receptor [Candidatus Jordarchaeales archaeon]